MTETDSTALRKQADEQVADAREEGGVTTALSRGKAVSADRKDARVEDVTDARVESDAPSVDQLVDARRRSSQ